MTTSASRSDPSLKTILSVEKCETWAPFILILPSMMSWHAPISKTLVSIIRGTAIFPDPNNTLPLWLPLWGWSQHRHILDCICIQHFSNPKAFLCARSIIKSVIFQYACHLLTCLAQRCDSLRLDASASEGDKEMRHIVYLPLQRAYHGYHKCLENTRISLTLFKWKYDSIPANNSG